MIEEKEPLFGKVPPEHWPKLAKVALIVIDKGLPSGHSWQDHARADLAALLPGVTPAETVTSEVLDAVMDAFGKENPLGEAAFAAFLAAPVQAPEYRTAGNALSAWILAAALRRQLVTPEQNALRQGLAAARGIKLKAPDALAELDGALADPTALLKTLDRLRKDYDRKTVRGYFQSLAALMRSAIKFGPAIHRSRDFQEVTSIPAIPQKSP